MRPVAVLSDIHGNLAALEAVLDELASLNPRAYLVLGDSFGELGAARAVFERLAEFDAVCLMGNREWDMAAFCRGERSAWQDAMQFAPMTESAAALGDGMKEVSAWPITRQWEGLRLAHGSPDNVRELLYPGTTRLDTLLEKTKEKMLLVGHDHRQWAYQKDGKHLLAVGSLGLCHVGRAFRSQYGLLWQEDDCWKGKLCEIGYDGAKLRSQLKKESWIERTGAIGRAGYEEAACGYQALFALLRAAIPLCEREYGKILNPLPNEILEQTMRIYPWKSEL